MSLGIEAIEVWLENLYKKTKSVKINKISMDDCNGWFYDDAKGVIRNKNNTFFSISGIREEKEGVIKEQPIIIQDEIGYLGLICKKFEGEYYFLMQAKIEPGNINYIQISPTIQATKSNFTQKHGGKKTPYVEYFLNVDKKKILVDQIQSEQSSRFLKKRNRNIIVMLDENEEIEVRDSHFWMTLKQIKQLMKKDNLVNMDTRTVLSCIPYFLLNKEEINCIYKNNKTSNFLLEKPDRKILVEIFNKINNYKMFNERKVELVKLNDLQNWEMKKNEIVCKEDYPFKVIFCDITIDGREVKNWCQPLFEAIGKAMFVLFICKINGSSNFLVKLMPEIGCHDGVELGPTIQLEANESIKIDSVTSLFEEKMKQKQNIIFDTFLSEEGGRFYHEENRNIIIEINQDEIENLPDEYIWSDFATLNMLVQVNNCLNIQLRNLLSVLEV